MFQTVTYHKINGFDLEKMIADELGVVLRGDVDPATGERDWDGYQLNLDLEMGQDSHFIVNSKDFEGSLEDFITDYGDKSTMTYMKRLHDKGLLPTDHPIFVDIWW